MSPGAKNNDDLYWQAYCRIVKSLAATNLGSSGKLFLSTSATRGPIAADSLPTEVTNYQVYRSTDSSLDGQRPLYAPNHDNGYTEKLLSYLLSLDLAGNTDPGMKHRYENARQGMFEYANKLKGAVRVSFETYKEEKEAGLANENFSAWAQMNAPSLQATTNSYEAASAEVAQMMQHMNGPLASQWKSDKYFLDAALYPTGDVPGTNMRATTGDVDFVPEGYRELLGGRNPGARFNSKSGSVDVPQYSVQGYADQLKQWLTNFDGFAASPTRTTVSLDTGRSVSIEEFGFSASNASLGQPLISFADGRQSPPRWDVVELSDPNYKLDITLTYGDIKAFPLKTGKCDIDISKYKGKGKADQAKDLVRPTKLICGAAVGLEVKFSGGAEALFGGKVAEYKRKQGSVRIFGFEIGLDADSVKYKSMVTHLGTWDATSNTFTAKPTLNAGLCTVLGIVGENVI